MFERPSKSLRIAVRDFVFRHEIFVEACEFDDGVIFVRRPKDRSRRFGPRRYFEVFLRRKRGRVHFHTLTCGSEDDEGLHVGVDFHEKARRRKLRSGRAKATDQRQATTAAMSIYALAPPVSACVTSASLQVGSSANPAPIRKNTCTARRTRWMTRRIAAIMRDPSDESLSDRNRVSVMRVVRFRVRLPRSEPRLRGNPIGLRR